MNEIILAPCDVISKIKQNSSDMNEIILAPCDAGYVQSCTGLGLLLPPLLFGDYYCTILGIITKVAVPLTAKPTCFGLYHVS
jgi:hypothetical protein